MSLTVTLPCIAGTSLSYHSPSQNFANRSEYFTSYGYYDFTEAQKREKGYADIPNVWYWDAGVAILRFDTDEALQNVNIKKATLKFRIVAYNSNVQNFPYVRHSSQVPYYAYITQWDTDLDLSLLTLNTRNIYDFPSSGEKFFDLSDMVPSGTDSEDIEINVTSSFNKNIYKEISTFIIGIGVHETVNGITVTNDARQPYGDDEASRSIIKSTAYIEVEYELIPPDSPTPVSPVSSSFVEDEPITFSWNYNSSVSSPQASATIEYKLTSASTWTTVTSSGAGTTYTLNAGLSAGSYQWRVKVTDGQGETSSYSATKTFTVVEQAAPTPTYPVDTGLAAYAPIAFAWTFNKPSSASAATQASATLQYRARGSGIWIEQAVTGSSTTWTLAAGLSVGQYEWRVCVTNNYGETSSYCNIVYFQIVAQSVPTPVSPGDNITLFEGHAVVFNWIYNSLTPATQASATIKYRVVGGSTWTTYTSASSNPFCSISDIPQGQYEWCLNVTNNYGETSADSGTLEFNIIGRPQRPIITTPANCCLTTISWNASGQEAAEFILMQGDDILIHETVATAVTSYKPQMFLKGTYKAMARIKNNSDLWSDYGELEFTIDAAAPTAGNLIAMPFDTEIKLEGTYTSSNAAIVRIDEDGTENVISMTAAAIDKKIAGTLEYAYVLRCWDTGGYVDTPLKVFTFNFEGSIFTTDTEELHLDRSEQKFLAHDEELGRQYATMRYVGREFPVIERGEYTEQTLTKQFHVTKAQRRILDRMAKEKALFYRDSRGNAFKAAILGVSYTNYMADDYIATIKLTRTAADEVIINV